MHGKTSLIYHDGRGVYRGLPNPFEATRYHSLVIQPGTLPDDFEVVAWTDQDEIMGVRHKALPLEGVQYHPESFLTDRRQRPAPQLHRPLTATPPRGPAPCSPSTTPSGPCSSSPALPPRRVPLAEALGCTLAEEVTADRDLPPFDKALLDGYAVRAADLARRRARPGPSSVLRGDHRRPDPDPADRPRRVQPPS